MKSVCVEKKCIQCENKWAKQQTISDRMCTQCLEENQNKTKMMSLKKIDKIKERETKQLPSIFSSVFSVLF